MGTYVLERKYYTQMGGKKKPICLRGEKCLLEKLQLKYNLILCYWNEMVLGKFFYCIKDLMSCFYNNAV